MKKVWWTVLFLGAIANAFPDVDLDPEEEDYVLEEDPELDEGEISVPLGGNGVYPAPGVLPTPEVDSWAYPDLDKEPQVEEKGYDYEADNEVRYDEEPEWKPIKFGSRLMLEARKVANVPSAQIQTSTGATANTARSCSQTFDGTSGAFSFNGSNSQCAFYFHAPAGKRIYVQCNNVTMKSCSTKLDDYIVASLTGDSNFNTNSYYWCGPQQHLRAVSLGNNLVLVSRLQSRQHTAHRCAYQVLNEIKGGTGGCGRNSRIVGGSAVSHFSHPWLVQIEIHRSDDSTTSCSGSIITKQYILTAAHCLRRADKAIVFVGGVNRGEIRGTEMLVEAEKYILHPRWNPKNLDGDLALLRLTYTLNWSPHVAPVCLPNGRVRRLRMDGQKLEAAGWGRIRTDGPSSKQLMRAKIPVMDYDDCKQVYRRYLRRSMMCVDSTPEAAICYGDSGGPLMYDDRRKIYQVGIASFSLKKSCGRSPDVFTKVATYYWWIRRKTDERRGILGLIG